MHQADCAPNCERWSAAESITLAFFIVALMSEVGYLHFHFKVESHIASFVSGHDCPCGSGMAGGGASHSSDDGHSHPPNCGKQSCV